MSATWDEFEKLQLAIGRILVVEDLAAARRPAYKLRIDFGPLMLALEAGLLADGACSTVREPGRKAFETRARRSSPAGASSSRPSRARVHRKAKRT